ncbi:MAG: radical SAM protein [Syntrophobacteraceae bacterium]
MKYDVEADWILLYTCNFRCPYCFFPAPTLSDKIKMYGTAAQWREGFQATGRTWLLHITGGEPTLYPEFVDLCDELTQNNYLSINSNLSHHCIKIFVQRINPERVHFINAAIHLEEREKHYSLNIFIERVHELRDAKFNVLTSLVMTPHVVNNISTIYGQLEANGLFAIPKVIRGTYAGNHYPTSYSDEQRRIIYDHIIRARQKYGSLLTGLGEPPTINMFSDDIFLKGVKDYRGRLCDAGYRFVKITPEGSVRRCESSRVFGNILSKGVRLSDAPELCDTSYCPYFCEKYSVEPGSYYAHLRVKMLNLHNVIQTEGCMKFVRMMASKLMKRLC